MGREPVRLGASDCEQAHDGLVVQPMAATSSIAYVLAGLWLMRRSGSVDERPERHAAQVYAGLLSLVGVGSVLYHGPQWPGSRVLHDAPILLVAGQASLVPLSRVVAGRPGLHSASPASLAACGALAGVAAVAYWTGRTGGPLCRPDSAFQPHAVWHVASAAALGIWGSLLWSGRRSRPTRRAALWRGRH